MDPVDFKAYVAGFLFNSKGRVLLVRKTRPEWQAGLMNAVGGLIEPGEPAMAAMIREADEEMSLRSSDWQQFCIEEGPGYRVHFFRMWLHPSAVYKAPRANDRGEELEWCDPASVKYPVVGNLNWLLPMAGDPRTLDCVVRTNDDIRRIVTW